MARERISGARLQAAIVERARLEGWAVAHFRPARTAKGYRTPVAYDGKGYPDLTLVRDRVVFAEVKGDGDSLRLEQQAWLELLELAGAEVYVWTPALWLAGSIDEVLRRRGRGVAAGGAAA